MGEPPVTPYAAVLVVEEHEQLLKNGGMALPETWKYDFGLIASGGIEKKPNCDK